MIEIKFLSDYIEPFRDFCIELLQNNIIYRMRKQGNFIIIEIPSSSYDWLAFSKDNNHIDENLCNKYSLQIDRYREPFEFKAFSLKVY